jgi:hypothetical protein
MTQTNETLDRFMAELMGWHIDRVADGYPYWWLSEDNKPLMLCSDWHPSTDIAQAMECAEKWCEDNDAGYELEGGEYGEKGKFLYRAIFTIWLYRSQGHKRFTGEGTKELAICLALYEAVKGGE